MQSTQQHDPHAQLRNLYMSLLTRQEHFDEFKQLLALYPSVPGDDDSEIPAAVEIRTKLNQRIRDWTGVPFTGLSSSQIRMWRAIVVEDRINIALSPWKESNNY